YRSASTRKMIIAKTPRFNLCSPGIKDCERQSIFKNPDIADANTYMRSTVSKRRDCAGRHSDEKLIIVATPKDRIGDPRIGKKRRTHRQRKRQSLEPQPKSKRSSKARKVFQQPIGNIERGRRMLAQHFGQSQAR